MEIFPLAKCASIENWLVMFAVARDHYGYGLYFKTSSCSSIHLEKWMSSQKCLIEIGMHFNVVILSPVKRLSFNHNAIWIKCTIYVSGWKLTRASSICLFSVHLIGSFHNVSDISKFDRKLNNIGAHRMNMNAFSYHGLWFMASVGVWLNVFVVDTETQREPFRTYNYYFCNISVSVEPSHFWPFLSMCNVHIYFSAQECRLKIVIQTNAFRFEFH